MAKILVSHGKMVITRHGGFTTATPPTPRYSITANVTYGSASGDTSILQGGSAVITITPITDYMCPASVLVSNATLTSYDQAAGTINISNPIGNVLITVACIHVPYSITTMIEHGTYSGDTTIAVGGTATVNIAPDTGYTYPSDVTVTGASKSYNASTGVITLSNPTGAVAIAGECEEVPTLAAPTISLSGDVLSITDNDGNATSFDIYVDGAYKTNVAKSS